jgi:transposase, IS30 family
VKREKKYNHLSAYERDKIAVLKAEGVSISEIAKQLGRNKSTISREIRRNSATGRRTAYYAQSAQQRAGQRWLNTHQKDRISNPLVRAYVDEKIREKLSPELIAGRIGIDHPGLSISHETVYQYIYAKARYLIPFLVRGRWVRAKRGHSRKHRKPHIPNRTDISCRPEAVSARKEPGHWESDAMVSRQSKEALNALVERTSRLTLLTKLPRNTSGHTSKAITKRLMKFDSALRKSITYDNGSENVEHEKVNAALGTDSYFCAPYRSWEKGTVENTIGLVRRWLPKKTDLQYVPDDKIVEIENWLNNRPRKCLGFKTPLEVFNQMSVALNH